MPVNSELFRKIADVIEHNPDGYNQRKWGFGVHDNDAKACRHIPADQVHTCGTSHCIAGWAVALTPVDQRPAGEVSFAARELLGLGESESHFLFAPNWSPKEGVTVPGELRRIAEQQSVFETATAGFRGTATAGDEGVIVVWRIVGGNRLPVVGAIGETLDADGVVLEARQPYRLNDDGKWVKAPKPESK